MKSGLMINTIGIDFQLYSKAHDSDDQNNHPMHCQCCSIGKLEGAEAKSYAREHLIEVRVDEERWVTELRCPEIGERFLLEYPHAEYHGGGSPVLRKMISNNPE
ncbi:MAG: hypothetical protein E4G99_11905 [Anaerolineales bacterium]|nr:MAG: hypothetical protein E4G99_11905 [Anaerolineales bacterium]